MVFFRHVWDDDLAMRLVLNIEHEGGAYRGAMLKELHLIRDTGKDWHSVLYRTPIASHGAHSLEEHAIREFESDMGEERLRELCEADEAETAEPLEHGNMKTKRKLRYYCDWCKKSGGSKHHLAKHERGCTLNPRRVLGNLTGGN